MTIGALEGALSDVVDGPLLDAELLDNLFHCLGAGVYATDWVAGRGGRVIAANPRCGELLGYTVAELLGAPIHDLVHYQRPDGTPLPAPQCALFGVGNDGASLSGQDVFWRRDGSPLPIAWAGAPLRRDGVVVGTVIAFTDDSERRAAADERERALHREHAISVALQRSHLTAPPDVPGAELTVRYLPAALGVEVGGDWYDALVEATGDTLLVVGDVIGHDTGAAAAMGQLRALVRNLAYAIPEQPALTLTRVDRVAHELGSATFATVLLARLGRPDPFGDRPLDWASAGHPPALVVTADGATRWLAAKPDQPLGLRHPARRETRSTVLPAGATLLMFTDGLVERRFEAIDDGLARLASVAAAEVRRPLGDMIDAVVARLVGDGGHEDDVAVLALRTAPGVGTLLPGR